ncbi:MAG: cohesin domain-containing protein [Thiotrichaceae bacterium]
MNKNFTLKLGIAFTALTLTSHASATTQTITAEQFGYEVDLGESFDVPLSYTSDSSDLTGLGLTLVFDSNKLAFEGFSSSLQQDLLAADTSAKADSTDIDKDASTDNIATIAWASLSGDWPGKTSTPLTVARFKVIEAAASDTAINISGSAASNSTFSAEPIVVTVGKTAEQPTVSASNATSTSGGGGSLTWYLFPLLILLSGLRRVKLVF